MDHFISTFMNKQCFKCKQYKPLSDFSKCKSRKDGFQGKCKVCEHDAHRQRYENPCKRKAKIEKTCEYNKIRRENETMEERQRRLNAQHEWYDTHKEDQHEYQKHYMKDKNNCAWKLRQTPEYIIASRCRQQTRAAFKHTGNGFLKKHTKTLLGVSSWKEAKTYLESLFVDGMNWNNMQSWHIDHIKPISSFDLSDPQQFADCFNIRNLQPLWAIDNIKKGNKY